MAQLRSTKLREAGDLARELQKLTEHPSWELLREHFEARKQAYLAKLARDLTAGGLDAKPLSQREIDYQRGFLRGAQAVLDAPENAVKVLDDMLRREGTNG